MLISLNLELQFNSYNSKKIQMKSNIPISMMQIQKPITQTLVMINDKKIQEKPTKEEAGKNKRSSKSQQRSYKLFSQNEANRTIQLIKEEKQMVKLNNKLTFIQVEKETISKTLQQQRKEKIQLFNIRKTLNHQLQLSDHQKQELQYQMNTKIKNIEILSRKIQVQQLKLRLMQKQQIRITKNNIIDQQTEAEIKNEIQETYKLRKDQIIQKHKVDEKKNQLNFKDSKDMIYKKYQYEYSYEMNKWIKDNLNDLQRILSSSINSQLKHELIEKWIQLENEKKSSELKKRQIQLLDLQEKMDNQTNKRQIYQITFQIDIIKKKINKLESSNLNQSDLQKQWLKVLKYVQYFSKLQEIRFKDQASSNQIELNNRISQLNYCMQVGITKKHQFDIEQTRFYAKEFENFLKDKLQILKSKMVIENELLSQIKEDYYQKNPKFQEQQIKQKLFCLISSIQQAIKVIQNKEKFQQNRLQQLKRKQSVIIIKIEQLQQVEHIRKVIITKSQKILKTKRQLTGKDT